MNVNLFEKIDTAVWKLPKSYRKDMKKDVHFIATEKLLKDMEEHVLDQASNVASLPGLAGPVSVMPDAHFGYGFPVGGVAAFDLDKGVISPGGIGFDINCGVRLLTTNLDQSVVKPKIKGLVSNLFGAIPTGIGKGGLVRLGKKELKEVMVKGVLWAVSKGMGWNEDLKNIEAEGRIKNANPDHVSDKAIKRGLNQLGSLGSGNHFLEIQEVEAIFDEYSAKHMGIYNKGQVVVMVHCGSRGFGHQIATDYLRLFENAMGKYNISVPDRQLACAPFSSPEGQNYYSAMACAANYAFCNRQILTHGIRRVFSDTFGKSPENLGMNLVYDVAHNIAKVEKYKIGGETKKLVVHRKGATRSFGSGQEELPEKYRDIGQPVIIGGSMETGSYLLLGTKKAHELTFASTAHGSGRTMSRAKAKRMVRGEKLQRKMRKEGIYVISASMSGLAEEAGVAYKDINEVVKSVSLADISKPAASFKPIGNIKG